MLTLHTGTLPSAHIPTDTPVQRICSGRTSTCVKHIISLSPSAASYVRLEDTSVFHRFFIGRISKVIAQYENALIVRIISVSHDSKDPSPPPCVQLTLPMGIIQLNLRDRISRRYLEARDRLHAHCPPTPASLRKELAEFEEAESSDSGTHNFGGEILVRSSQDPRWDNLLKQVRSLGPLPPLPRN